MQKLYAEPLSEPMLAYYCLDPWKQFAVKFASKYNDNYTRI